MMRIINEYDSDMRLLGLWNDPRTGLLRRSCGSLAVLGNFWDILTSRIGVDCLEI